MVDGADDSFQLWLFDGTTKKDFGKTEIGKFSSQIVGLVPGTYAGELKVISTGSDSYGTWMIILHGGLSFADDGLWYKYGNALVNEIIYFSIIVPTCPMFNNYVFWPSYNSELNDIGGKSADFLETMILKCSSNSDCKGLNTNGFYKSYVKPLHQWTKVLPNSCQGLYIKTPDHYIVNNNNLDPLEVDYIKWIVKWTVPNFNMTKYDAISKYLGTGTWWSLKEGVFRVNHTVGNNAFDLSLCNYVDVGRQLSRSMLYRWGNPWLANKTCTGDWQVGIAGMMINRTLNMPKLEDVVARATSAYCQDVKTVLGRSAILAGYNTETSLSVYNQIVESTEGLQRAWLLKAHLVGFYFSGPYVDTLCFSSTPAIMCYGKQYMAGEGPVAALYAPNATSIQRIRDEVVVLLQSLPTGSKVVCT